MLSRKIILPHIILTSISPFAAPPTQAAMMDDIITLEVEPSSAEENKEALTKAFENKPITFENSTITIPRHLFQAAQQELTLFPNALREMEISQWLAITNLALEKAKSHVKVTKVLEAASRKVIDPNTKKTEYGFTASYVSVSLSPSKPINSDFIPYLVGTLSAWAIVIYSSNKRQKTKKVKTASEEKKETDHTQALTVSVVE